MYLDFYNLKEKPFNLTPDPAFLFYSNAHRKAVAFLKYGLEESKGFLQLTGPIGSGKTTLLRTILAQLDEKTRTAYIINPCASFTDLLRSIMRDLEISAIPQTQSKIELLDFFHDFLLVQMKRSQPVIAIFDEAQNLSLENLEEIRMLSNFETTKDKLIQIVFVGQPELIKKLDRPELRQLKQRIQVKYHLAALSLPEVQAYINHRLSVAGSEGEIIFSDDACREIYNFSGGIPRLINSICDIVLLIGYVNEWKEFDAATVKEAMKEMSGSFDDQPVELMEEGASQKTGCDLRDSAEISATGATGPDENEMHPLEADTGTPTEVSSTPTSEGIIKTDGYGPGDDLRPTGAAVSVAEAVVETEPLPCPPDSSPETDDHGATQEANLSDKSSSITETHNAQPFLSKSLCTSLTHREKEESGPQATESEHARKGLHAWAKMVLEKWKPVKNGTSELAQGQTTLDYPDEQSLTPGTNDTQFPCPEEEAGTLTDKEPIVQASREDTHEETGSTSGSRVETRSEKNGRKGRVLRRRKLGRLLKHSANRKAMILFQNGKTVRGTVEDIDLTADGFQFCPHGIRHISRTELISFEQILAIRLVEDYENGWDGRWDVTSYSPKGRQILVTLMNGDLIEGITLSKFDPGCQRFFVVSPDENGETSWVLLERSGAAGILTDGFKDGIYAEEFAILPDIAEPLDTGTLPVCQHEIMGDFYFSIDDHSSAITEYQKARSGAANRERLDGKISLACFNSGIRCLRTNQYAKATEHFEKAATNIHLREKAHRKIKQIEKMCRN